MADTRRAERRTTRSSVALVSAALVVGAFAQGGCDNDRADNDFDEVAAATAPSDPLQINRAEAIDYRRALELTEKDDVLITHATGDRAEMSEALEDLQVSLAAANGQAACHEVSDQGQLAAARSIGSEDPSDCRRAVARVGRERRKLGQTSDLSKVLSATTRGLEGTARVLYPDGSVRYIPFVNKQGLVWQVTSLDLVDGAVLDNEPAGPGHDFSDPHHVSQREEIEEVLYDIEADFPRGLGNSVCHELTPAGRRQVERSGVGSGDCAERVQTIARRALMRGYQPRFSEFRRIQINGNRAVAIVKSPGHPRARVPFVRTSGGWKLPSVRYAGNVDLQLLLPPAPVPMSDSTQTSDAGDPKGVGAKADIAETLSDIQGDFARGIGSVCFELSEGGERELAQQTKPPHCTTTASRLSRQLRHAGVRLWTSKVVSVDVHGRRATALLETPGRGSHGASFVNSPLKGWRLTSLRHAEPIAKWLDR